MKSVKILKILFGILIIVALLLLMLHFEEDKSAVTKEVPTGIDMTSIVNDTLHNEVTITPENSQVYVTEQITDSFNTEKPNVTPVLPETTSCTTVVIPETAEPTESTEPVLTTPASVITLLPPGDNYVKSLYLGVKGYWNQDEPMPEKEERQHVFLIDGKEELFSVVKTDGYLIQNTLKKGYEYYIEISDGKVISVVEAVKLNVENTPIVSGVPGEKTIKNFLTTAIMPMGKVLYVYGGGWNWQDDGASDQVKRIGLSEYWWDFFISQNDGYTYNNKDKGVESFYPFKGMNQYYYAGLDCSGYLGWVLYNTINTQSGLEGYVLSSGIAAKSLSEKGWGVFYSPQTELKDSKLKDDKENEGNDNSCEMVLLPGDVVSIKGHVWICLGSCEDGSVVVIHSTPSQSRTGCPGGGVQISAIGNDKNCMAYVLADYYMRTYCPIWYERYCTVLKKRDLYFDFHKKDTGIFSWDTVTENSFMKDPEGIRSMSAEEILKLIFCVE